MQMHQEGLKSAQDRIPGFDHELRLAAVRRGQNRFSASEGHVAPLKGNDDAVDECKKVVRL
jgi:hypothetical protein